MGGFVIGTRVALLWQHNANPSYKLASIPRYDDIVRTAGWAGSARAAGRRATGGARKTARRIREAGASGPPPTGAFLTLLRQSGLRASTGGVLAKKRTQNVSEYMLVLDRSVPGFVQQPSQSEFGSARYLELKFPQQSSKTKSSTFAMWHRFVS